jgi:hypothetical protein
MVEPPTYIAVDTEGLGDNMFKYPTVAIAFMAMNADGDVLHSWQIYMPYDVSEEIIEPRCWKEFWNNPKKCKPEIYTDLQKKCRNSPHSSVCAAWKAVSEEIDKIYTKFPNVIWVSDCPDYDIGRIEAGLSYFAERENSMRYDQTGRRHKVKDSASGLEFMKQLFPSQYKAFKATIEKSGQKTTHDCLDDAKAIAFQYVKYLQFVEVCQDEEMKKS